VDKQEFMEKYRLRPTVDSQDTERFLRQERFRAGANAQLEAVWPDYEQLQNEKDEYYQWWQRTGAKVEQQRAVIEELKSDCQAAKSISADIHCFNAPRETSQKAERIFNLLKEAIRKAEQTLKGHSD